MAHADAFRQLETSVNGNGLIEDSAARAFANSLGLEYSDGATVEELLAAALDHIQAPDAIRIACTKNGLPEEAVPRTAAELAHRIFPDLSDSEAEKATTGLLTRPRACASRKRQRAVDYACSPFLSQSTGNVGVHRSAVQRNRVTTGKGTCPREGCTTSRASHATAVPAFSNCCIASRAGKSSMGATAEQARTLASGISVQNTQTWPHQRTQLASSATTTTSPFFGQRRTDLRPLRLRWSQETVERRWRQAQYTPSDGLVRFGGGNGYWYDVASMHSNNPPGAESAGQAYPGICPRCDADWSWRTLGSPVRTQRTGFQKISQVLCDTLLRDIPQTVDTNYRKIVVFSDSRQDAAKLAPGMRVAHYRDAVRQALTVCTSEAGEGRNCFSGAGAWRPTFIRASCSRSGIRKSTPSGSGNA